jgi:hypothetical protein
MDKRTQGWHAKADTSTNTFLCNCIGPQDGKPLCPCLMRGIIERDGRYIRPEQDLGPVVGEKHE